MPERIPIKPETLAGIFTCALDETLNEYLAPHLAKTIRDDVALNVVRKLETYKEIYEETEGPGEKL